MKKKGGAPVAKKPKKQFGSVPENFRFENAEFLRSTARIDQIPAETLERHAAHPLPYDENLLERAHTQWQFGDWESLTKIDRDTLQHHPDRAKLALLAAAGRLQNGNNNEAKQFIRLAQDWGVSKKLVSQILIAGVHNSLGRTKVLFGNQTEAMKCFKTAIALGTPGGDTTLLARGRANEQLSQLSSCLKDKKINYSKIKTNYERPDIKQLSEDKILILESCSNIQEPLSGAGLEIGNRKVISEEMTYGDQGFKLYYRPDSIGDKGVVKQLFKEKQYEFGWLPQGKILYSLYENQKRSGKSPVIIDAGANIGASSIWFLLKFPQASIIAIEPDRENCELLKLNNAGRNVLLFQGGLADERRILFLNDPGQSDWGFRVEESGSKEIDCVGPNEIINYCLLNNFEILIFKIDIEGGEAMVFEGECNWIKYIPLIIIELHDWMLPGKNTSSNFLRVMANRNFDLITRGENIFCFNRDVALIN